MKLTDFAVLESPHFLARCAFIGPQGPSSVIVKQITSDEFTDASSGSAVSTRLLNELATLEFLEFTSPDGPWPAMLAADADAGLIVIEDLGVNPSVLHLLLADDSEAARSALQAMGRCLAEFHMAGLGHSEAFRSFQRKHAALSPRSDSTRQIADVVGHVQNALDTLHLSPDDSFWSELEDVDRSLSGDIAPPTLIHADAGPQNFIRITDERTAILDFEFAVIGHPALDLVSARLGFPHTKDSRPLLPADVRLLESAYRTRIARAIPWAEDDSEFGRMP